jgi:hypothetical protein
MDARKGKKDIETHSDQSKEERKDDEAILF